MTPDELDRLIRVSDPVSAGGHGDQTDLEVDQHRARWSELSRRRVVFRKRVRLGAAAAVAFILFGGIWVRLGDVSRWRSVNQVAQQTRVPSQVPAAKALAKSPPIDRQESDPIVAANDSNDSNAGLMAEGMSPSSGAIRRPDAKETVPVLAEFEAFIDRCGSPGSDRWRHSLESLAQRSPIVQRAAIDLVPRIVDTQRKSIAFELICQAAGEAKPAVLRRWLSDPAMRPSAWQTLVDDATLSDCTRMVQWTSNEAERVSLCQSIASVSDPRAIDLLIHLTGNRDWRPAVRNAAAALNADHVRTLIQMMRQRDSDQRTAVAFVMACIPGEQVDRVVASMVLNGRYRQPAYMVLMSRNTAESRAFLAHAAERPNLTPALFSARMHFATIETTLHQWIIESQGTSHEQSDSKRQPIPHTFGDTRHLCRCDMWRERDRGTI